MREYERRVRLFEASTGIDASYRAQKLMAHLSGEACAATETLDLEKLKSLDMPRRVSVLLSHL